MNFVYISPQFPKTNWEFCDRLKQNGVTVLGIADVEYDELDEKLKNALTEYYRVSSLENYDEVLKAVGYFTFKYGKIDWLESNNEYWLEQDAKLRTDFNITTGIKTDKIQNIKEKSAMKSSYKKGEISTAAYHMVSTLPEARKAARSRRGCSSCAANWASWPGSTAPGSGCTTSIPIRRWTTCCR